MILSFGFVKELHQQAAKNIRGVYPVGYTEYGACFEDEDLGEVIVALHRPTVATT